MVKKYKYIGTVRLFSKGKVYGAKTSQVNAKGKDHARRILKKNFKFKDNKVTVTDIHKLTDIRRRARINRKAIQRILRRRKK